MSQDRDGSIALPASWVVNTAEKPINGVWGPTQVQSQVVPTKPIDPVRHFGCTLRPAVTMKAKRYARRSFRGTGIEPVNSWRSHDCQAFYRSEITGRPNHEIDLGYPHTAAISVNAVVASAVAMMIPEQSEDRRNAATFAFWSSVILGEHRIN
jgi:hypothetical protein